MLETDLIDLSSPNTYRTDGSQSDIGSELPPLSALHDLAYSSRLETQRQQLSQIPSLHQILASTSLPAGNQQHAEHRLASLDCDDPLAHHLVRYSDLMSNELESKPITEKMDHWYLDLKKNLMVNTGQPSALFILSLSLSRFARTNSTNYGYSSSKNPSSRPCTKNKRE